MAFTSAVGDGNTYVPGAELEKDGAMYLCCAELFPGHEKTHSWEMFHGIVPGCSQDFKDMLKFLIDATKKTDVLVVADGRSEVARKENSGLIGGGGW